MVRVVVVVKELVMLLRQEVEVSTVRLGVGEEDLMRGRDREMWRSKSGWREVGPEEWYDDK